MISLVESVSTNMLFAFVGCNDTQLPPLEGVFSVLWHHMHRVYALKHERLNKLNSCCMLQCHIDVVVFSFTGNCRQLLVPICADVSTYEIVQTIELLKYTDLC